MKKYNSSPAGINPDFFFCSVMRFMILLNILQLTVGIVFLKEGFSPSLMKCLVMPLGASLLLGFVNAVRVSRG